jgi:hypothetical protein
LFHGDECVLDYAKADSFNFALPSWTVQNLGLAGQALQRPKPLGLQGMLGLTVCLLFVYPITEGEGIPLETGRRSRGTELGAVLRTRGHQHLGEMLLAFIPATDQPIRTEFTSD